MKILYIKKIRKGMVRAMRRRMEMLVKDHMQPAVVTIRMDDTVEKTLQALRKNRCKNKVFYFYVVGEDHTLLGTIGTRALLVSEPDRRIGEIMDPSLAFLREEDSLEKAMDCLLRHRLLALPVIDEKGVLKGIFDIQVCLEENVDLLKTQRNQDVFQLVGITQAELAHKSPFRAYEKRMPWILCNMIGGVACAGVSYFYKGVLGEVLILAMFIPLVLTISESISTQSMTHSFQILRKHNVTMRKIFWQMFLETRVSLLMAFTSGALVGLVSLFWDGDRRVSLVIASGIAISVVLSSVIGASIPLFLHLKKLDPKVASGPVVLTIADVITTVLYLSIASCWLLG